MKQLRILEEWLKYKKKVVKSGTPKAVEEAMKLSFYAGASILYRLLIDLSPDGEPQPSDLKMLDDMNEEILEFVAKTKQGIVP